MKRAVAGLPSTVTTATTLVPGPTLKDPVASSLWPASLKKIASHLNAAGITCRGKAWRKDMIAQIVEYTTCHGDNVFNRRDSRTGEFRDDDERVITAVPPIIGKEEFAKAASLRAQRAHCGAGFALVSGKGGTCDCCRRGTRPRARESAAAAVGTGHRTAQHEA